MRRWVAGGMLAGVIAVVGGGMFSSSPRASQPPSYYPAVGVSAGDASLGLAHTIKCGSGLSCSVANGIVTESVGSAPTAATATALAADGTDCDPGQVPRGVDQYGNAEGCASATAAETDPRIGSLQAEKWCAASGTPDATVVCDQRRPSVFGANGILALDLGNNTSGVYLDSFGCPTGGSWTWSGGAWECVASDSIVTPNDCPGGQYAIGIGEGGALTCAAVITDAGALPESDPVAMHRVNVVAPLAGDGTSDAGIYMPNSNPDAGGYLTADDWKAFNAKVASVSGSAGNPVSVSGTTAPIVYLAGEDCPNGGVWRWNTGTDTWECVSSAESDPTIPAAVTCTDGQVLGVNGTAWDCATVVADEVDPFSVHLTGDQTVAGVKTFTDNVRIDGDHDLQWAFGTPSAVGVSISVAGQAAGSNLVGHGLTVEGSKGANASAAWPAKVGGAVVVQAGAGGDGSELYSVPTSAKGAATMVFGGAGGAGGDHCFPGQGGDLYLAAGPPGTSTLNGAVAGGDLYIDAGAGYKRGIVSGGYSGSVHVGANVTPYSVNVTAVNSVNITSPSILFSSALPVSSGGTGQTTATQGGVPYGASAGALQWTPAGTAGQVLTSDGTSAPIWGNVPRWSILSLASYTTTAIWTNTGIVWSVPAGAQSAIHCELLVYDKSATVGVALRLYPSYAPNSIIGRALIYKTTTTAQTTEMLSEAALAIPATPCTSSCALGWKVWTLDVAMQGHLSSGTAMYLQAMSTTAGATVGKGSYCTSYGF